MGIAAVAEAAIADIAAGVDGGSVVGLVRKAGVEVEIAQLPRRNRDSAPAWRGDPLRFLL